MQKLEKEEWNKMEQKKIHKNGSEVQSGECRKYLLWEHSDQTKVNLPKLQKKKCFSNQNGIMRACIQFYLSMCWFRLLQVFTQIELWRTNLKQKKAISIKQIRKSLQSRNSCSCIINILLNLNYTHQLQIILIFFYFPPLDIIWKGYDYPQLKQ